MKCSHRPRMLQGYPSSLLVMSLTFFCGCTGNDQPDLNVGSESRPQENAHSNVDLKTNASSFQTNDAEAVDRSQSVVADDSNFTHAQSGETTRSVLLDDWNGDPSALPSQDSLNQGWDALVANASTGNAEAQFRLGILMLMTKPSGDRIFEPADGLDWLRKAAEQRHGVAASELAAFYYDGILVDQDRQEAERLYELGAAAHDPACLFYLGKIKLQRGEDASAVENIREAAQLGLADAQCQLAELYLSGNGLRQDRNLAREWYLKSARQGHVVAQYNMGMLHYFDGQASKAKPWLARAANQGYVDAMTNLSVIFFDESDFDSAEHYVNQAIAHGSIEAISMRTAIQRQRNLEDQIQEGIYSTGFSGF